MSDGRRAGAGSGERERGNRRDREPEKSGSEPVGRPDGGDLYLGTATSFPDGGAVALADQPESAGIRGDFYQKATGRSVAQIKATWARITFTGKGTPPKELKGDADVKAFVAGDPKAIGYVDSSAVDGSVKAVLKL